MDEAATSSPLAAEGSVWSWRTSAQAEHTIGSAQHEGRRQPAVPSLLLFAWGFDDVATRFALDEARKEAAWKGFECATRRDRLPDGGERPSSPRCRSSGVKLEAA